MRVHDREWSCRRSARAGVRFPAVRELASALTASVLAASVSSWSVAGGDGCVADINGDRQVDGTDLALLLGGWDEPGATDLNGSGVTDGADLSILLGSWGECPDAPLEVLLVPGSDPVQFTAGGTASLPFEVRVSGLSEAIEIAISQSASPTGLLIESDLPGGLLSVASDGIYVFNTTISSTQEGAFVLSTLANWSAGNASSSVAVSVLPVPGVAELSLLSAEPGGVNGGETTAVVFTIAVTGTTTYPSRFELRRVDAKGEPIGGVQAELRDDGVAPDLVAGDGVFAGQALIAPAASETAIQFRAFDATALAGGSLSSEVLTLPVTPFPIGTSPSDPGAVVEAPDGSQVYSNQLFVSFVKGTSDARIDEIVADFGGEIAG
jgi:hypothetical protein